MNKSKINKWNKLISEILKVIRKDKKERIKAHSKIFNPPAS